MQIDNHEKILSELRLGKYYISYLETKLNIPRNTIFEAIAGNRKIPKKYLDLLLKELRL